MSDLAVYIHWPFCQSKCPYCDFNSHVNPAIDHEAYRHAYMSEIAHYAERLHGRLITSIFFGGGTPSLMEAKTVEAVIDELHRHMPFDDEIEITLEANPGSSEAEKFKDFHNAGVNRLSLGVQSLRNDALTFLGRAHDVHEAKRAITMAQKIFSRSSFDLIYARHEQSLSEWEIELNEAIALAADHLSLYQLTIEPGTQFSTLAKRQELTAPLEMAANMFELTQDILSARDFYLMKSQITPGLALKAVITRPIGIMKITSASVRVLMDAIAGKQKDMHPRIIAAQMCGSIKSGESATASQKKK